eukprot:gnl/MRDRNA2_/MRDRNA2_91349_c0_seq1.p1 gnl/MRDRNA2_/MRDRNA2_91349_c0~~gnl/MRDRNA2_/MRDRNA2_91349_c0_seq1.p1  ORF type:complete len:366 (+),score=56.92 gnl/MRDRNA2_/MRDRNA2_91349_c0_seq1:61-1158(+)
MTEVFALEVVADHVTVKHAKSTSSALANSLRPAVGVRFLDLPAVVIDAPAGQGFPPSEGSIAFHGRGKALLFELPQKLVAEGSTQVPLPLWLTVLARPQHAVGSEQAFLVGSACLDMRAEAAAAALGRPSTLDTPIPYRACTIQITSVRGIANALRLQCRLRLFRVHGDHHLRNGIEPGETRLEHQTVIESDQSPTELNVSSGSHGVAAVNQATKEIKPTAVSVAVQANCPQSISTQTENQQSCGLVPHSSEIVAGARPVESNTWADLAQVGGELGQASVRLPGEVRVGQVRFPEEIHVLPVALGAPAIELQTNSSPSGGSPAVKSMPQVATGKESSLPLVAQLTRELCQLQELASDRRNASMGC